MPVGIEQVDPPSGLVVRLEVDRSPKLLDAAPGLVEVVDDEAEVVEPGSAVVLISAALIHGLDSAR